MSFYLKINNDQVFVLIKKITTIGKENCDINPASPLADDKHAVLEFSDTERSFVITDLNSQHGTFVNGCLIRNSSIRLSPGDIIKFDIVGQEYKLCCGEVPKVLTKTVSLDQSLSKQASVTFPPIPCGSGSNPHFSFLQSSDNKVGEKKPQSPVPPINVEEPTSASLRRTLSHGSLSANREKYKEKLQRSHSGDDIIPQPEIEVFKDDLGPKEDIPYSSSLFEKYVNTPIDVGLDFRLLHNVLAASNQSSPRTPLGTSFADQTANYRSNIEETMEKHNELRQLSEQMHDLKTVDQDGSAAKLETFLELREKEARMVRDELNRFQRDKKVLSDILSQMAKDLINKDAAMKVHERNVQEKDSVIKTYVRGLQSKEEFILEQVRTIQQKDEVLKEQAKRINERDEIIRRLEEISRNREEINKRQLKDINERANEISELKLELEKRDEILIDQKEVINNKEKKVRKLTEDINHKDDVIKTQTKCLLDKEDKVTELNKNIDELEKNVANLEDTIREKDDNINLLIVERDRSSEKLNGTRDHLVHIVKLYIENSSEAKTLSLESSVRNVELVDVNNILVLMEETLKREMESVKALKNENEYLSVDLHEERTLRERLEGELNQALSALENLRESSQDTIKTLEVMNTRMKESLDFLEHEKKEVDMELSSLKDKCRNLEEMEKELKQKLTETELELDSFRRQVIQTTFAIPGTVPPSGPISTRNVVTAIEQLATERNEMSRKIAELKGQLRQYKLTQQEENMSKNTLQDLLTTAENKMKTKGRWQSMLNDIISKLQSATIGDTLEWMREIVLEIYRKENRWQLNIEQSLNGNGVSHSDFTDCGELIRQHLNNLTDNIKDKEKILLELKNEFVTFKETAKKDKDALELRHKTETDNKLKEKEKEKEKEMDDLKEKLRIDGEMLTQQEVEKAIAATQQKAEDERENILCEKNNEIEKLKENVEENFSLLEQKEATIQELSEKLEVMQQEYEGKLDELSVSQEVSDNQEMEPEHDEDKVMQLKYQINQLSGALKEQENLVEDLRGEIKALQEKSNELMAEKTRRPSSIPGSRKGRYAMNLERLVQNLSIENASFKLQLDQRDAIVVELRNQISTLKQRHMPANLAELQQREMNELLEQLKERDNHIENLRLNLKKMMEDINKREVVIAEQEEEIRLLHDQYHTTQTAKDVQEVRKGIGDMHMLNGFDESPSRHVAMMPTMHEIFRCRYCKHDRKWTSAKRQDQLGLNILQTRSLHPSSLSSRASPKKPVSGIISKSMKDKYK